MNKMDIIKEIRKLIIRSAPNPRQAEPIKHCRDNEILDKIIPFSSLIVLGMIIAIEDRFRIKVTREAFQKACSKGATLSGLADMITELQKIGITSEN
ncbi:MAG: hypothetical protein JSW07_13520 [bacterium]|nr:MAG: hypothetical protein JSW07_13520 [bacterium]